MIATHILRCLTAIALLASPAAADILSFGARDDFPTGPSPRLALPARANDDEYTDLLVSDDGGVSVLFGTPVGRLAAPLPVTTEIATTLFAAGDFDGDGYGDIAYTDRYGAQIVLRRSDGNGGFDPWTKIDLGGRVSMLATADIDADQRIDLLATTADGITLLLNQKDGHFERRHTPLTEAISGSTIGDLNHDGKLDVILLNPERRYLVPLENLGNGRLSPLKKIDLNLPAHSVALIDNGKGADLAIADNFGVTLVRRLGPDSYAEPERLYESNGARALAVGHFNRDRHLDLAATDEGRGIVLILAGEGSGRFRPAGAYDIGQGGTAITSFELGEGAVPGLVVVNRRDSCVTILRSSKDEALAGAPVYGAGEGPIGGVARDLNGDHHLDLVIADEKAGAVLVYLGTGQGRFAQHPPMRTGRGTSAVAVADFDSDHKADIVAVNSQSNDVAILAGTGDGTFAAPLLFSTGMTPTAVATLDANGDGHTDLAIANNGSRSISVLAGDGEGRLLEPRNYSLPQAPEFVIAGDLDADGHSDVVVGYKGSDEVSILRGEKGGLTTPKRADKGERIRPSIAQDFDTDRKIDLAMVDAANDRVGILLGTGDNVFQDPIYFPVSHRPTALIAGDFNEDRRPDLIVISNQGRTILLLNNTSSPGEEEEEVVVPSTPGKSGDPWRGKLRDW